MAYIKIDKKSLTKNLKLLSRKSGSKEKLAVVLKDNAYGHGAIEIAQIASEFGIKEAVVANYNEALKIKEFFKSILVLGGNVVSDSRFSFAINDFESLKKVSKKTKIELKVDTGMHRNGISFFMLKDALEIIKNRGLNLVGVMSHYRSSDELSSEYFWQKRRFKEVKSIVKNFGFQGVRFHSHNSAGLLRCNSFDEDIARVGIGIYGYSHLPESFGEFNLEPVLSLWAKRVSTKWLKAGQRVGYGGDFIIQEDGFYSTYDLGYGDGWQRGDSKRAYTLPDGQKIIGRVSMDFITLKGAADEVCIMNNAKEASKQFDTISYEITTRLSPSMKRIVV
jgi:alanine racemase